MRSRKHAWLAYHLTGLQAKMDEPEKRRRASQIASEIAGQWQNRSRVIILIAVIVVSYLIDYLFFRYERAGEFTIFVAFLVHLGLQVWVPERVYLAVYSETYQATLKNL